MKLLYAIAVMLTGTLAGLLSAQVPREATLRQLYDDHRWFELREAVQSADTPALYRCAVASAFNRRDEAERCLRSVIGETGDSWTAAEARDLLGVLYLRTGRAADSLAVLDDLLRLAPQRGDLRNVRTLLTSVSPARNQTTTATRLATVDCSFGPTGIRLPVSINGRAPVTWLLDTGFTTPALSQREAEMLGLVVRDHEGRAVDGSGGSTTFRVTRADRLVIGQTELRNVLLLVFPDSQPPWSELAPGTRGIVGLPVALALEGIRATSRGRCEIGQPAGSAAPSTANLTFNGLEPVVRVGFGERTLEFLLDTGNQARSQLWERFGSDFPLLTAQGTQSTVRINQIGSSTDREVVVLPELQFLVGGHRTTLTPANVFSPPVGDSRHHGNLGMDILSQAADVLIDFRSMALVLR